MRKNKMFVVEGRRVLPLLFLLVLLVSLSVYDTFRASPTVVPNNNTAKPNNQVSFTTADKGERKDKPTFRLAVDGKGWTDVVAEWAVAVPKYPFQPQHEVALFALHAEVQNVKAAAVNNGELEVVVTVNPKRDYYQVVTLPVKDVTLASGKTTWKFVDRKGNLVDQLVIDNAKQTSTTPVPQK